MFGKSLRAEQGQDMCSFDSQRIYYSLYYLAYTYFKTGGVWVEFSG